MRRVILLYGLCGGLLIAALRFAEYRFLVVEHSIEIYAGLIAVLFAALGIRLGLTMTKTREVLVVREVPAPAVQPFVRNDARVAELGITPRELEILERIAARDRRGVVRQRKYGEDARQPPLSETRCQPANPGRARRQAASAHPLNGARRHANG